MARIYLDVPYESRGEAKAAGARWDPQARSWYAPQPGMTALAAWAPLPDRLPGEDREFGSGLFVDLVPSSCWLTNVRSAVSPGDWERLRKMVYRRAGHRCEACGAGKNPDARRWLEAHERWRYLRETTSGRLIQKLTRIVCLCTPCHQTTHFGHAQIIGQEQDCLEHLCHVNDWTPAQAWEHIDAAFGRWQRRSEHLWELDLSILTDVGVTVTRPPEATERAEHAASRLGVPAAESGSAGHAARGPRTARDQEVEPRVSARAVSRDEVATSDDPMARVLRGEPPFPSP